MDIIVTGSLAYDRIMEYPQRFSDSILPDSIHRLNVSFLVTNLNENFGGTAGNIAYGLSLLSVSPILIAAVGRDFEPYARWLKKHNISIDSLRVIEDELTAGAYITTDSSSNQITSFNLGAMKHPAPSDLSSIIPKNALAIVAPGNLEDMSNYSQMYKRLRIQYIFDPGQSLPAWQGDDLLAMIDGSSILISNDYELELIMEKTRATKETLLKKTKMIITTKGENGSRVLSSDKREFDIAAVSIENAVDPTGAGDSFRAGLIRGLMSATDDIHNAVRMGSVAASFCVETQGTQNYTFSIGSFKERFYKSYGAVCNTI